MKMIYLMLFIMALLLMPLIRSGFIESVDDPYGIPEEHSSSTTEYGATWDRSCDGGTCNMLLYSGVRNADDKGTRIEDAKSLKDCQFCDSIKLSIDSDGTHLIGEVLDYNSTSLTAEFYYNESNLGEYEYEVEDEKMKTKLKIIEGNETIEYEIEIEEGEKLTQTIPFGFDKVIEWGENSTFIRLNGSEIGEDAYVHVGSNWNYGILNTLQAGEAGDSNADGSYIKFNLSIIPSGQSIDDSGLCFYIWFNGYDTAEDITTWLYGVDNNTWVEGTSTGIDCTDPADCGGGITGNRRPTIGNLIDTNTDFDGDDANFWLCFNSTSWVSSENDDNEGNVSFWWNSTLEHGASDYMSAWSAEYTTDLTLRPYLNITYSPKIFNLNITSPTTASPASVSSGDNLSVTFDFQEGGVNLTSGVEVDNVTIGGSPATLLNFTCSGTLDCSQYTAEANCENCSQCNWTVGEAGTGNITYYFNDQNDTDTWDGTCEDNIFDGNISTGCGDNDAGHYIHGNSSTADGTDLGTITNVSVRVYFENNFDSGAGRDAVPRLKPYFNGIPSLTYYGPLIGDYDEPGVWPGWSNYSDITSDAGGPGVGSWTWADVQNLDMQISTGRPNAGLHTPYRIDLLVNYTTGGAGSCEADTGGACATCTLNECNTNCSEAGCVLDNEKFIVGTGWQVNITVPTFASGLKDLFLNATYDGNTRNNTQTNAVDYGGVVSAVNCTFPNDYGEPKTINMSWYCNITTESWAKNLNFTDDAGWMNVSSILNVTNITNFLAGQIIYMAKEGRINIKS